MMGPSSGQAAPTASTACPRRPRLGRALRGGLALALATGCLAAGAQDEPDDAVEYEAWSRRQQVSDFERYLADLKLGGVVKMRELLRTASDWRRCSGPRFELPPRERWGDVALVLKLLAELKQRHILGEVRAVSNYRNAQLNACAGGASHSSHTRSFAIDIVPTPGAVDVGGLCNFWRTEGKRWRMGVSRYPSGRIHLDTSGFRTWGADHTSRTAICR